MKIKSWLEKRRRGYVYATITQRDMKYEERDIIYSWMGKLNFISLLCNIAYGLNTISLKSVSDLLGNRDREVSHEFR